MIREPIQPASVRQPAEFQLGSYILPWYGDMLQYRDRPIAREMFTLNIMGLYSIPASCLQPQCNHPTRHPYGTVSVQQRALFLPRRHRLRSPRGHWRDWSGHASHTMLADTAGLEPGTAVNTRRYPPMMRVTKVNTFITHCVLPSEQLIVRLVKHNGWWKYLLMSSKLI